MKMPFGLAELAGHLALDFRKCTKSNQWEMRQPSLPGWREPKQDEGSPSLIAGALLLSIPLSPGRMLTLLILSTCQQAAAVQRGTATFRLVSAHACWSTGTRGQTRGAGRGESAVCGPPAPPIGPVCPDWPLEHQAGALGWCWSFSIMRNS